MKLKPMGRWIAVAVAALAAVACGGGDEGAGGGAASGTAGGSPGATGAGGGASGAGGAGTGSSTGVGPSTGAGPSTGTGSMGSDAPRMIAPLSTSTVTSQTPSIRWALPPGADGARVEICADRACAKITQTIDAVGTSATPTTPLGRGVFFVRLFSRKGATTSMTPSPVWEIFAGARSVPVDTSYGTVLDADGDGHVELAIAAPDRGGAAGSVYLYAGTAMGVPPAPTATLDGADGKGSSFGASLASAGDVNGDGFADLIVGEPDYPAKAGKGRTFLFLGGKSGLAGPSSATLESPAGAPEAFGATVTSAGDVNGDGYADVLIGAPTHEKGSGRAYLFLGGPGGLPAKPDATLKGANTMNEAFGVAVASAGDVNGDGFADVVVGAYSDMAGAPAGKVHVLTGSKAGLVDAPIVLAAPTPAVNDAFGLSLASAGDLNGDGYADVIVGAPRALSAAGRIHVFSGGPNGTSTIAAFTLQGTLGEAGLFGWSLSAAGDVNRDGYGDLVAGEPDAFLKEGRVHVFEGSPTGPGSFADAYIVAAVKMPGRFGVAAAIFGDANGDGYDDVAVGAPGLGGGSGEAYAFPGGPNDPISLPKPVIPAPPPGGLFGQAIAR